MADLNLYVGEDQIVPNGSGIGFYGDDGFGDPIPIGDFNGRTFVTDASGTIHGFEANNNKRLSSTGVIHGQTGSGILLTQLPNTLASLNIRFSHSAQVNVQNALFYVYDGTSTNGVPNKNNDPSGLTAWCAEIRKNSERQDVSNGLGDSSWIDTHGSTTVSLVDSPGTSGLRPLGDFTVDTRHDWYISMSVTPNQFGDKFFGILVETEFL
jgi:hypothetical protein